MAKSARCCKATRRARPRRPLPRLRQYRRTARALQRRRRVRPLPGNRTIWHGRAGSGRAWPAHGAQRSCRAPSARPRSRARMSTRSSYPFGDIAALAGASSACATTMFLRQEMARASLEISEDHRGAKSVAAWSRQAHRRESAAMHEAMALKLRDFTRAADGRWLRSVGLAILWALALIFHRPGFRQRSARQHGLPMEPDRCC